MFGDGARRHLAGEMRRRFRLAASASFVAVRAHSIRIAARTADVGQRHALGGADHRRRRLIERVPSAHGLRAAMAAAREERLVRA